MWVGQALQAVNGLPTFSRRYATKKIPASLQAHPENVSNDKAGCYRLLRRLPEASFSNSL
jgi:hypothetical protein